LGKRRNYSKRDGFLQLLLALSAAVCGLCVLILPTPKASAINTVVSDANFIEFGAIGVVVIELNWLIAHRSFRSVVDRATAQV
jgi:hypothetical protein